ncbi:MAG: hypothetical protein P8I55_09725 [Crocinitomix sp.]|nr:hypothetical protein [Crocinitomix sp.]
MNRALKYLFLTFTFISISAFAQVNQKDAQGRKQGVWKKPYENSTAYVYIGQFKNDKPYGVFTYYYESGKTKIIMDFRTDGKTSYAKMYHESGYLMARGKYINQEKDSTWVQYDDRGVISYQEDYKRGKLDGQRVVFYEPQNGKYKVMEYSYWKAGLQHGEYKKYHPNSNLAEEGNYVDGNKHGAIKHYHPNGKIARIDRYKYAVKHGYQVVYNDKGIQTGYKLYWEGAELKNEPLRKKEAELKALQK